jgi:hypothetical protein
MRVRWIAAVAALAVGLAGSAKADPANWKQVDADAKWVVSLDVDALLKSNLANKVYKRLQAEHPEAAKGLSHLQEVLQFVPIADLHGVTVYSESFKKGAGVAVVNAKAKQQSLLELVANASDHRVASYGKHEIHTWTHAKGSKQERGVASAFFGTDVIVFSGSTAEVQAALDVLDGKKPSLDGNKSSLTVASPAGTVLTVRAIGFSGVKFPHELPPVVKKTDAIAMSVGEDNDTVFIDGKLTLKDSESAELLQSVVEGGRAAALLAHGDDEDLAKLIRSLKITDGDKAINVTFQATSNAIENELKKIDKKIKSGELQPLLRHHPAGENHPAKEDQPAKVD